MSVIVILDTFKHRNPAYPVNQIKLLKMVFVVKMMFVIKMMFVLKMMFVKTVL